jgi:uncharacterized protein YebE (UPF0316 family)
VKIFEVSISVVRLVLITKGEKKVGAVIGFFEVIIWLVLVATVLNDIMDDPIKIVIYALGFSVGQVVGSMIESKIGIGTVRVEAITLVDDGNKLVKYLREEENIAVTVMDAQGMKHPRKMLIMYIPRFKLKKAVRIIRNKCDNVVLTTDDVKPIFGGYRRLRK